MKGVCSNCGPVDLIWKISKQRSLRCSIAVKEQRGNASPEQRRLDAYRYSKRAHGLTQEQAQSLKDDVGSCEICMMQCDLVVDHNHATKEIRGVLCRSCNTGLGMFRDNIDNLRAAIFYLSK